MAFVIPFLYPSHNYFCLWEGDFLYLLNWINSGLMKTLKEYMTPESVVLGLEMESPILEGSPINTPGIEGPEDSGWITNK